MSGASRLKAILILFACGHSFAFAGELKQLDRIIGKEPAYKGKPKYGLLVFDRAGKERVWFVQDGDTLYVDRQGNGDLTDPKNKIAAKRSPRGNEDEWVSFDVGELSVGGRVHKAFGVNLAPLKSYDSLCKRDDAKTILAKDPGANLVTLFVDANAPGMKGGGIDGRVKFSAGPSDLSGLLRLADTREAAPVIYLGGPMRVTFYNELPSLRVGRSTELVLVVGAPGIGPGTLATIYYDDTIPEAAKPIAEVTFPPMKTGAAPVKENFELKARC
jgi:hypothetical protein